MAAQPTVTKSAKVYAVDPPPSTQRCTTEDVHDGLKVTFLIDPLQAKRLKMRAGTRPLYKYLWENILQRAVDSEVF
jgi:hypothetical protein